ncbi:unnamed protein product [Phaedon cochleariae]|uniref:Protein kinase domain-containing protein n=1 Tax=Phaedon cochleariae TaxID=80249 RepID=A0A9N9X0E0_PHACE|nr:unnamed protein product [Phaedon cochleariae]
MQNAMPEILRAATPSAKTAEAAPSSGEVAKKLRFAHVPRAVERRVPRVSSDRDAGATSGGGGGAVGVGGEGRLRSSHVADKYELLEQVEGSSLYRCVDVNTKEELVCKIASHKHETRDHSLVSAHYKLDFHPRVSSLHEVLARHRYLYLVFPKAHGDLHSYVRQRKRLRESEARRLFKQCAEAVQVCHENGIVLRDLKLRKFVFVDQER